MAKSFSLSFDSLCLAASLDELQPWVGGRLQRIVPLDRWSLALGFYQGSEAWLVISLHPRWPRAHLAARRPGSPAEATPFVISLRKALLDTRLVFARQRGLDRVVDFGFSTPEGPFQLVAELTGRHAALILVDPDAKIAAADKFLGPGQTKRPILPGKPYLPPPFDLLPSLLEAAPDDDWRQFEGCSPSLLKLKDGLLDPAQILDSIQQRKWSPCLHEEWGPYPLLIPGASPKPLFGPLAEAWYLRREQEEALREAKASLQKQIERVLLARQTAQNDLASALEAADKASATQRRAELILAYQGMIRPGASSLDAWDYEGNPITIPLKPDLSPLENANLLFEKARKAKDRKDEVRGQHERISSDILLLDSLLLRLESTETVEEVAALKEEAAANRWLHKASVAGPKEDRPYEGHPIRELLSPGGWKVLYGVNSTANDYLTTKVARPNDWWLHVRGGPSAHVVLQTQNQPLKVQREDLLFAAQVAARNSPSKHSSYVPIDYTLKKHVRKPRKSAPGLAVYVMEKTIHVEPGGSA